MSNKKKFKIKSQQHDSVDEKTLLGKMTRSLEILVRLNLHAMRGDRSQGDMISMLDSVGCGQSEIAALLGTTANTVNVALYKAKKKAGKK
jgi:DNA-directed RNA polymerase specialized sigma24 family protein